MESTVSFLACFSYSNWCASTYDGVAGTSPSHNCLNLHRKESLNPRANPKKGINGGTKVPILADS